MFTGDHVHSQTRSWSDQNRSTRRTHNPRPCTPGVTNGGWRLTDGPMRLEDAPWPVTAGGWLVTDKSRQPPAVRRSAPAAGLSLSWKEAVTHIYIYSGGAQRYKRAFSVHLCRAKTVKSIAPDAVACGARRGIAAAGPPRGPDPRGSRRQGSREARSTTQHIVATGQAWGAPGEPVQRGGGLCCHLGGVFAQRVRGANYCVVHPGNTPANHPPTEACTIHSKQHRRCRIQDLGTRGYRRWKAADFSHSAGAAHGAPP